MSSVVLLALIAVVFYLFIIAPQRRRQRQAAQLNTQLGPGVQIVTTAGLFATVHAVTDDAVELEVAPGVVSRYSKAAVARIIPPEHEAIDDPDEADRDDDDDPDDERTDDGQARPGHADDQANGHPDDEETDGGGDTLRRPTED